MIFLRPKNRSRGFAAYHSNSMPKFATHFMLFTKLPIGQKGFGANREEILDLACHFLLRSTSDPMTLSSIVGPNPAYKLIAVIKGCNDRLFG